MIIRDEEKSLGKFLQHHAGLYDELVIADTGASDDSAAIAKRYTPAVFHFEWRNDFSAARNFSISKATGDWILWLDPDEFVKKDDFAEIRKSLSCNADGLSMLQRTWSNATGHPRFVKMKNDVYGGYYLRRICKLFRNRKGIAFEYPIHETVRNSIAGLNATIRKTRFIIDHYPEKKDRDSFIKKEECYIQLLKKKLKQFPKSNAEKELAAEEAILKSFKNA